MTLGHTVERNITVFSVHSFIFYAARLGEGRVWLKYRQARILANAEIWARSLIFASALFASWSNYVRLYALGVYVPVPCENMR